MKPRKTIADIHDRQTLRCLFKSKVVARKDGCQIWSGSVSYSGYGQVSFEGRTWSAHRLAYEIANGPIAQDAKKWWVLHKCDNPACCNPDHLYLGDAKDNANDMIDRKRQRMGFKRYGGGEDIRFGRVFYEIGGEIRPLYEWAEILEVNPSTLEQRISAGWPEKDLSLSSKIFKRHLKADGQTCYRRFSGSEEVENYKREALVAVTTKASESTILDGNIDMKSIAKAHPDFTIFKFGDKEIRVIDRAGEPWFVAKDVCDALELTNSRKSLIALDDDERSDVTLSYTSSNGVTQGRDVSLVSESGMYTLVLRCRDAVNKGSVPHTFRKWVTAEVLPSIRKNGEYAKGKKTTVDDRTPLRDAVNMLVGKKGLRYDDAYTMVHQRFNIDSIDELSLEQIPLAVEYIHRVVLEGEFLGKQEELPAPKLDISFPMSWFAENAPYAIIRQQSGDTVSLDRNVLVDCSPAYRLLDALTKAGYDVEAARTEIKALRTIMAEQSWALKEIASYTGLRDKACHSVRL